MSFREKMKKKTKPQIMTERVIILLFKKKSLITEKVQQQKLIDVVDCSREDCVKKNKLNY